jgi:FAD/FMN-containing dehydrogenase
MKRRQFVITSLVAGLPFITRAERPYLHPGSAAYDKARQLFNSDLTCKPAYIARCRTAEDVQAALRFAREQKLTVSVKSGGHCFTGSSMADGSLSVDLSALKQHTYLPDSQRLLAGPGLPLGELYDFLLPKGRILPAGSCSGVGLGGLTLGGGYGLFSRQWGLTCDHLTRVKMVAGHGEIIDSKDDPDLLWACRGGGNGNFGIVTSMEFETRPVRDTFAAQRFVSSSFSPAKAKDLLRRWFAMAEGLADPIFSAFVFKREQISVLLTSSYTTSGKSFQRAARLLRQAGFSPKRASDAPTARALKRYYGRQQPLPFHNVSGGYYRGVDDLEPSLDFVLKTVTETPHLIFQINTLGGAIAKGPDSAYPHRAYPFLGEIQAYWQNPSQRENLIAAVTANKVSASVVSTPS